MVKQALEALLSFRPLTLLGVGPMSATCVDATIELAKEHDVPIMLVASRRQVECGELGRGYVEGWTTQSFADYVRERDASGNIVLCRDHGGPWQGNGETEPPLDAATAMERAKISYAADIDAGFSVLHVDPSIDPLFKVPPQETVLERLFELYRFCWRYAQAQGRRVVFEIGTEEQVSLAGGLGDTERALVEVERVLRKEGLPMPLFVVVQTGTKVEETRNVGVFGSPLRVENELPAELHVPLAITLLRRHGVYLKQHNTDYLDDENLSWLPRLGVSAANVAPEFGVVETRTWLELMRQGGREDLAERFVALSLASGKWKKWLSANTATTDLDRAVISGHYVFSTSEFREIATETEATLAAHAIDARAVVRERVKAAIRRYLVNFRLVR
ncbi:MAG: class II D-tagatose-bisphosphate aldolase non-catalytic subunit [Alphaproteobacteria bacterium]